MAQVSIATAAAGQRQGWMAAGNDVGVNQSVAADLLAAVGVFNRALDAGLHMVEERGLSHDNAAQRRG